MLSIGQSLECWRPPLAAAVARRDANPLLARARGQIVAGADGIDVNFGARPRAGLADDLGWASSVLRDALPGVPLFLDCGDLDALAAAVAATPGPTVANALALDAPPGPAAARLLAAVAATGAGVVLSPRAADREDTPHAILAVAAEARALAVGAGIGGPIYLDCLAYPAARQAARCRRSLAWARALADARVTGVAPLVAAGNVGHGAPEAVRAAVEAVYVVFALASGVTALLVSAEDSTLMSLIAVMEGASVPRTDLERWALEVRSGPAAQLFALPPPGEQARSAWTLLTADGAGA
jgi:cobalamin-dependent methionine synthase I